MAGIGEAASIIAVIQISTQIFGVCQTYYSEVKGARTDIQLLRNEVTSLQDVLMNVKDLADNPGPVPLSTLDLLNQPTGPLAQCRGDLSEILTKLDPGQGLDGMRRFGLRALKWPFNIKEISKVIAAIGRHKETFKIALSADNIALSRNINDQMSTLTSNMGGLTSSMKEIQAVQHTLLADEYQQKIQRWLLPPDPSSNHNAACQKRQSKTGTWFTEGSIFSEWKITPSSFLWLYGIPGCGKTILSSNIIQDIGSECSVNPTFAIIYFYFDFNDAQKQNFEYLLRSLTAQLCTKSNMAADTLNALYSRNQDGKQQPMTDALITTFQCMLEGFQQVYIILDALDECKEREELLRFLETIAGWKINKLHILATSRRESDITETLEPLVTKQVCIQSELISADICTYIRERLQNDRGLKKWPSTVQSQIETTLTDGAHGMFRWVVCQLDELQKCLKLSSLQKTLKSLPKTLDDTYARILLNISEEHVPDAFKLLQWLAYSARPLRIEELAEVVAIDLDEDSHFDPCMRLREPRDALTICSSLVTTSYSRLDETETDSSDSDLEVHEVEEVRLAHFSVKEYLSSDRIRTGPAPYYSIAQSADNLIAQACLIYLLQFNEANLPDSLDIDFPLASYAAEYWPQHVRGAEKEGNTTGLQRLCTELLVIQNNAFHNCVQIFWPPQDRSAYFLQVSRHPIYPLYYASYFGLSRCVQKLIEINTKANAYKPRHDARTSRVFQYDDDDDDGNDWQDDDDYNDVDDVLTALIAASFKGHETVVQQLLETCANVDSQSVFGKNALEVASRAGHGKIVQRLLEGGADINAGKALREASKSGHETIVHQLLRAGADISAQNQDVFGDRSASALQAASLKGHDRIVQVLLKAGADANTKVGSYRNALHAASSGGHDVIIQQLLNAGADVNAQSGQYGNALYAASSCGRDNTVQILLKAGADVNAQGGYFKTYALHIASENGHSSTVKILLKAGADVNAQGGRYGNALQVASVEGNNDTVKILLNAGADVNTYGGAYGSALQAASSSGLPGTVKILLKAGADINAYGGNFGSALQVALEMGYISTVEILRKAGAKEAY